MIRPLSLIKHYGHERVRRAVEEALALGCADAAAMRHLAEAEDSALCKAVERAWVWLFLRV